MNDTFILSRRQFLRSTGEAAAGLAAASSLAPALLSAPFPGSTIGVGCIGLGTRGGDLIANEECRMMNDPRQAS